MRNSLIALAILICLAGTVYAQTTVSHAIALHGEPKYGADFTHFDYVTPDAPKGGTLRLSAIGTFDNFHRYAQRGVSASASTQFYDTLMTSSDDEIDVLYPLIAEQIEYPADYSYVIFHINPAARHQDGRQITAEDVAFSFTKFFEEGVPQFKQYYAGVSVEVLSLLQVRFSLEEGSRELIHSLASLTILPKHYWESRDFSEPLTVIPLGSGAYTVEDYKIGQYVVYKRLADYWGMNLPVNKGRLNFDFIRYDYYRDQNVAFEAFKAGEYDLHQENISKNWATLYTGANFENGHILKEEIPHEIPQGMQALVYNIQRPFFSDRRVREALNLALDFEWMNENLFYGQYTRTRSYFQNTEYEATGLPSAEELEIFNSIKSRIPPEVFSSEYNPNVTDGSGNIRTEIREALRILKEAGWEIREVARPEAELNSTAPDKVAPEDGEVRMGLWQRIKEFFASIVAWFRNLFGGGDSSGGVRRLVNVETGEPMEFELLLYSPSMERVAIPIQKNLERMGVTMNIRVVDTTQFTNRLRERDFDMISGGYSANPYPSSDLKIVWRSDYLDYTYNTAGVQDEAVDYLIDGIIANQENPEALLYWGRALDRVLTWNYYVMPEWHISMFRVASWNKFSRPEVRPVYDLGIDTWWYDEEKAATLPDRFR
jgi:microcin C transport system substrate-binding protein